MARIAIIAVALAFLIGLVAYFLSGEDEVAKAPQIAAPVTSETAKSKAPAAKSPIEEAEQKASVPVTIKKRDDLPVDDDAPRFDVVRVSPDDGMLLAAGRAPGQAVVNIIDNGGALGSVVANNKGEWLFQPTDPLAPGTHELTLQATDKNGKVIKGRDVVVLVVPERGSDKQILSVVVPEKGDARILQGQKSPDENKGLTLDLVDYDDKGNVVVSGKAEPEAKVRLYVDNKSMGTVEADDKGQWKVTPDKPIEVGEHMLRVDQLDKEDKVVARIELPFLRAAPHLVLAKDGHVVVQPGNSLWRIARHVYGTGFRFATIYEANKEQIRDPNLIYPGQIFELPKN